MPVMSDPLLDWDAKTRGKVERRENAVALRDEGSDEAAVEADAEVGVTTPTEAIRADEHDGAGESAEAEVAAAGAAESVAEVKPEPETRPESEPASADQAGSEDVPSVAASASGQDADAGADEEPDGNADTKEPLETVPTTVIKPVPTAEPAPAAQPAEDPAPTAIDMFPGPLAGAGVAAASGDARGGGKLSDIAGGTRRLSWKIAVAATAAAVIVIGLVIVANSSTAVSHAASHKAGHKANAAPVRLVSISPSNGSTSVNGASPITVTYSGPVTKQTPLPTMYPHIAGSWQVSGDTATFTPQVGFTEDTHVTVTIPATGGTTTAAATSVKFTTGRYSTLRLDELLSQLGYIPLTWAPTDSSGSIPATDANAQLAAAYDPPAGTFTWESGYPAALTSQWSVGTDNEIIDGAVRTFEFDQNLTMDGDAGLRVWSHLLTAIARGERNRHGYTYVWVTQAGSEHLDLYHDGRLAITSPVNTGIAQSPTDDGTFPVYLRYTVTQMVGTNPDGTPYNDTVYWVSYFNGGDAVHAFPRASYGWYQSLGCVELPTYGSTAEDVWNLITYGTLVTVTGPVA